MRSQELKHIIEHLDKEGIVSMDNLQDIHHTISPFLPDVCANKILVNLNFFEKYFSRYTKRLEGNLIYVQGDIMKVLRNLLKNTENLLEKRGL